MLVTSLINEELENSLRQFILFRLFYALAKADLVFLAHHRDNMQQNINHTSNSHL